MTNDHWPMTVQCNDSSRDSKRKVNRLTACNHHTRHISLPHRRNSHQAYQHGDGLYSPLHRTLRKLLSLKIHFLVFSFPFQWIQSSLFIFLVSSSLSIFLSPHFFGFISPLRQGPPCLSTAPAMLQRWEITSSRNIKVQYAFLWGEKTSSFPFLDGVLSTNFESYWDSIFGGHWITGPRFPQRPRLRRGSWGLFRRWSHSEPGHLHHATRGRDCGWGGEHRDRGADQREIGCRGGSTGGEWAESLTIVPRCLFVVSGIKFWRIFRSVFFFVPLFSRPPWTISATSARRSRPRSRRLDCSVKVRWLRWRTRIRPRWTRPVLIWFPCARLCWTNSRKR